MSVRTRAISYVILLLLTACGGSGAASPGEGARRMGNPDYLLRREIERSTARSAYELVQSYRPQWLRTRGFATLRQAAGQDGIRVYMDNASLGGVDSMRRVPLASVEYLRFLSASEATQRWGAGHLSGAILISTQPRR